MFINSISILKRLLHRGKSLHILYFIFHICFCFSSLGQGLRLVDIWHYQKGDFPKDSLRQIIKNNSVYLQYNEVVVIEFAPINKAIAPSNYQYRIATTEKYDHWRDIGTVPIISFPALGGDHYLLEIRQNNKLQYTLPISIDQAFWERGWFIPLAIGYILFLIGIGIYFFSLYNLRQKLKLQDVRNRIAADLHDEVGSNLTSIAIFVALLRKKSPPELLPILDRITSNSSESVQLMQDTIWAIQSKNDDFEKVIGKMKNLATEILAAKDISLTFDNRVGELKIQLSMEQRKNAYLIYKEAVNNIVKHSGATKATIAIEVVNKQLRIQVSDNGCGFDANQVHEGNGLQNFITRAEDHGMTVDIHSEIDKGTTILLVI